VNTGGATLVGTAADGTLVTIHVAMAIVGGFAALLVVGELVRSTNLLDKE
jgi:hypothetical protein